jgi:hypothetical protein
VTAWKEAKNDAVEQADKAYFGNNALKGLLSNWSVNLALQDAGMMSLTRCHAVASDSPLEYTSECEVNSGIGSALQD